ncbi:uncharacterized protein LOC126563035 [Anopheles maculipalpis]|uniref:uncharacterized protein LOC126563035 n=1 Tax=Anopheles maculipalpis TaxID=1496333 RepID=UPI0021593CEA|nr:uncharacterized protein LOC126563035 [Anopheles maculipalpis]
MEYSSFVRGFRKKSFHSCTCPPDTEYAKEFEEQMQALVINYDIDDKKVEEQQHQYVQSPSTSTPLASGSGLKWKNRRKASCTTLFDETERLEVPKKKMAVNMDQSTDGQEDHQGSYDSSEGISMRFDSSSSNDDAIWNEFVGRNSNGSSEIKMEQQHDNNNTFSSDAMQGEDSLLEPLADGFCSEEMTMFATKIICIPAKRTHDEANS